MDASISEDDFDDGGGKADGASRSGMHPECWYRSSFQQPEVQRLAASWAEGLPEPPASAPYDKDWVTWTLRHVAAYSDTTIAAAVQGEIFRDRNLHQRFLEKIVIFDRSGAVVRVIDGKFLANIDKDTFLVNRSRSEWAQQSNGHNPFFFSGEQIAIVRHDGRELGRGTIPGEEVGRFRREWSGNWDDHDHRVVGKKILYAGQGPSSSDVVTHVFTPQGIASAIGPQSPWDARDCCGDGILCDGGPRDPKVIARFATLFPDAAIPDNNPAGVAVDVDITDAGGLDPTLRLIVAGTHARPQDLRIELLHDGVAVKTLLDHAEGSRPEFQIEHELTALELGTEVNGRWTIEAFDTGADGTGTIDFVQYYFRGRKP